jgi:HD superfamily phosphohydrolase
MATRTINDPIHGVITLTPNMCKIIDTPEFQRLHRLRQLGATYLVYPSATHTRFEHSLGVSHLAKIMLTALRNNNPDLRITDELIELYQVAGLVHDIGHGPFSHLYDDVILNPEELKHEDRGIVIFKEMVKTYNIDFTSEQVNFIVELIEPTNKNDWKFQIISNKYCSIDVDKIDYIQRDSFHLGFGINQTFERLLTMCDVKCCGKDGKINSVLCWPEKLQDEVMALFETRYRLHKRVYCHHTVKSLEIIINQILMRIKNTTQLNLEDLYDDIIWFPFGDQLIKDLQGKLSFRLIPKLIGEKTVKICNSPDAVNHNDSILTVSKFLGDEKVKNYGVMCVKIGFISGNGENPLINVPYFEKNDIFAHKIVEYSSFMAPKNCQEYIYRMYTDEENIEKARLIWNSIMK